MALWVEKHHGSKGAEYIADRIAKLEAAGEAKGADLWRWVATRYNELTPPIPIEGQGWTLPQ